MRVTAYGMGDFAFWLAMVTVVVVSWLAYFTPFFSREGAWILVLGVYLLFFFFREIGYSYERSVSW